MKEVVIVSAARTPVGSFGGTLKDVPAPKLGAVVIEEVVKRAGIDKSSVEEVLMGCVLPAAMGQAPARQAAIFAGLPNTVQCTTVNKVCGSGLKTVMLAAQGIMVGDMEIAVAGGMENMDLAPYAIPKGRYGYRMGNGTLIDTMVNDGLWDVYNNFHMGMAAEMCAEEYGFTREMQDEYAIMSYKRSLSAIESGKFKEEIVPVEVKTKKETIIFDEDEEPKRVKFDKIPKLRPAFKKDGTVTAANASSINDGAAAVLLMSKEKADELGLKPMARIIGQATYAHAPEWFTTAPAYSIEKLLKKTGYKVEDIDLWEINEAFAVVTLHSLKHLGLSTDNVNIHGGAVSIGHPIGASGARILVTLLYALKQTGKKTGVASLCIGGGEAASLLVEML